MGLCRRASPLLIPETRVAIEAVIFDFGNVICRFDNDIFLRRIAAHAQRSAAEIREIVYEQQAVLIREFETGAVSPDEFFARMGRECGVVMSRADFVRAFTDIFTPIETTFDLIRRLEPRYRLGLLSNTSEWDYEYGIHPVEVFDLFDAVSLSFEVGAMKPDRRIYDDMLGKLDLPPAACVYVDDIERYVIAARDLGMAGIHYKDHAALATGLAAAGVTV